jgi:hypothetical protein
MLKKVIKRVAALKIVKQGLKGYPSPVQAGGTSHNLAVAGNSGFHVQVRYAETNWAANFEWWQAENLRCES